MPSYQDLIRFVRGPIPVKPIPAIWDFFPSHVRAVGGVPNFLNYYLDVDEKLRVQLKLQELLPDALILPGVFPDLGVIVEVSAFGGKIQWFEDGAPFIYSSIREVREIDSLKLPAAGLTGLTSLALVQRETMRRKLREKGQEIEKWGLSMGPAEVSGLLMGYDKFYFAMYDDPQRFSRLLEIVTEFIISWLKKQDEKYGGLEVFTLADHVPNQVKPEQTKEFFLPVIQAIFASFPKAVKIYHNEGFHSDQHIELLLNYGADVWHFGSDVHELSDLYSKIGDRIILFGGLNPHGAMRHGTPREVWVETRKVVQVAKGHKILLSTGTGTTPDATLENQRAMVQAALAD
ncbi:MAG TPA: uroporphyrinogen decarboxylase family protein [Thermodesulfobacteriota bacterium]|nr:uroporphyrinogen decarboxylase family protein [Thermodesulfobacteriota bacterium]